MDLCSHSIHNQKCVALQGLCEVSWHRPSYCGSWLPCAASLWAARRSCTASRETANRCRTLEEDQAGSGPLKRAVERSIEARTSLWSLAEARSCTS